MVDKTITQLKSWLNLEPSSGCPYSCAYCFRNDDGDFGLKHPRKIIENKQLVKNLFKHPFFIPNETHLSLSGTKSDAFLPQNKCSTFEILSLLDEAGLKNRVTIVTKGLITLSDACQLASFKNIKTTIYLTYSDMSKEVESVSNKQRIQSLQNLHHEKVEVVLYWRPLIDGYNTSATSLKKVLVIGEKYADAFVISGLRMSNEIKKNFESLGLKIPNVEWEPGHKYISKETKNRIIVLRHRTYWTHSSKMKGDESEYQTYDNKTTSSVWSQD